ncbi:hypothetical protein GUITHDRAFT_116666 [Guillardia theta CCMP2712]|uniref:Protein kinase domain-containing protein n=1 Tax=Guillardia theta (strain CCMP2712) TaxID=905079 RepID=L1IMQ3_GUITC|nr:hypothetical protein GUITHDRAFT_116666 [Guillardia theta CCMP2712]EKX37090.1 hypothetical protein GUITHDRAFT_116666 [Guillardia theta CCMP2712]|eukprot:XP_005824070.1 hypothetical protein GUITHDRAFT_116666 [Guillardia theta CCMP2712]
MQRPTLAWRQEKKEETRRLESLPGVQLLHVSAPLMPALSISIFSSASSSCTSHHAIVTAQEALNLLSTKTSSSSSSSSSSSAVTKGSCQLHRPIKKTLSFADILDYQRLPQPPELCGLQAVVKGTGVREEDGERRRNFTLVDRPPKGTKLYVTLVMDFIDGKELRRILGALQYMHSLSLLHCDVSPRNLLVSSSSHAFLIDMGLAREEAEAEASPEGCPCRAAGLYGVRDEGGVAGFVFMFGSFSSEQLLDPNPLLFPEASWGMNMSEEGKALLTGMLDKEGDRRVSSHAALQSGWFAPERANESEAAQAAEEAEAEVEEVATEREEAVIAVDLVPHQLLLPRRPTRINYAGRVIGREVEG